MIGVGSAPDFTIYCGHKSQPTMRDGSPLTPAASVEIADLMIARWQAVKEKFSGKGTGS